MFDAQYVNGPRNQQLKLSLTEEEIAVIDSKVEELQLASRQDYVKLCISQNLAR